MSFNYQFSERFGLVATVAMESGVVGLVALIRDVAGAGRRKKTNPERPFR